MERVDGRLRTELAWLLRRFVSPQDAGRLREALVRSLGLDQPDRLVPDLPRVAALCEALGPAGAEEDIPLLRRVLEIALGELEQLRKVGALHLCGAEVAPAAAAGAAAILAISERLGLRNETDREEWRLVCLDTALPHGYHASYEISGLMTPPMPLLFARAPGECARFLAALSQVAQADDALSDVYYWLTTAHEQGVTLSLRPQDDAKPDWIDTLARRAKPAGSRREQALDLRALLHPADAQSEAMQSLLGSELDASAIAHGVSILRRSTPFADLAAIAVESGFVQRSAGQDDSRSARSDLNRLLREAGHGPIKAWTWQAPAGRLSSGRTPQHLNATLCAVSHACLEAAGAPTPEQAAGLIEPLQELLRCALIRHAFYRTLLLAVKDAPAEVARACFEPLRLERDPVMAQAVLRMAQAILRRRAGPILLFLLGSPAVRSDEKLAEQLVRTLTALNPPGAGERLLTLGRQLGWGTPAHGSYGVFLALAVAMGRLGVREAVPLLAGLVGTSGLGSEIEIALLRLAAGDAGAVDDMTFARAFENAAADEYAKLDASLMGDQARALLLRTLREEPLGSPVLSRACRFLAETPGSCPPPLALPLVLRLLPRAIAEAQAHPGEAWEDRNWGGYSNSPEEDLAEIMIRSAESLCEGAYSREGWRVLLDSLLGLPNLDQILVADPEPSSLSGLRHATRDIFSALSRNLSRLKDAGVDEALALRPPTTALRAARVALAQDTAGRTWLVQHKDSPETTAHE